MRRLKIYLDTSVISHLQQDDAVNKMNDTLQLWKEIKNKHYEVFISKLVMEEVARCSEPKRTHLLRHLNDIDFTLLEITPEMKALASEIIMQGILTEKSRDDCLHIAAAVTHDCDIIVSWNFKHMVNVKTINGVRAISLLNGYKTIDIYPPNTLMLGDD